MFKFFLNLIIINSIVFTSCFGSENFQNWLKKFQVIAIESGISEKVVNDVMSNAKYLPKVIEYDRFQPEFYEDTTTYISKRTSEKKVSKGLSFYKKNSNLVKSVEKKI